MFWGVHQKANDGLLREYLRRSSTLRLVGHNKAVNLILHFLYCFFFLSHGNVHADEPIMTTPVPNNDLLTSYCLPATGKKRDGDNAISGGYSWYNFAVH